MRAPLFVHRIIESEYWPWWFFYLPLLPLWFYYAVKFRSTTYFSTVNPGIEMGGFFGESKSAILNLINKKYLPKTIKIDAYTEEELIRAFEAAVFTFPVIAKPDIGERGTGVAKIHSNSELLDYHSRSNGPYIIQEYVSYPFELGILYVRLPKSKNGHISSVTLKEFMHVRGDGKSTIQELMHREVRSRLQIKRISELMPTEMNEVLPAGEIKTLEPIGNHCRGTRFINYNKIINEKLNLVFDQIAVPIDGFYYGRFDIRVKSIEDLYRGENIKILELNGVSSDPGHIYDSSLPLFSKYRDIYSNWRMMAQVSELNIKDGVKPTPLSFIANTFIKHSLRR